MSDGLECTASASFAEALQRLGASLAVTTLEAGRLVLVRPATAGLSILSRSLPRPMGLAIGENDLTVAYQGAIRRYRGFRDTAALPPPWNGHDLVLQPSVTWHTSQVDPHEMANTQDGAVFVNTRYSCLARPSGEQSFVPLWQPPFIDALLPEDRCHLNGLCVRDGKPAFVTALGGGNTAGSWRETLSDGGILFDIAANDILIGGLSCPHSPRWWDGRILCTEAGKGALVAIDPVSGTRETLFQTGGFLRGLAIASGVAFVGISRVRQGRASAMRALPVARGTHRNFCGVVCIDLSTGALIGTMEFPAGAGEVFDIQLLPNSINPYIANDESERYGTLAVLPNTAIVTHFD